MTRLILGAVVLGLAGGLQGEDWPIFRGPAHNGISSEKNWLGAWPGGQPKTLWKKKVGTGYSSMSVAGGRVFTLGNASNTDTLYCFDAATGNETWKLSYPQKLERKYYDGGPSETPTVAGGRVYSLSKQGDVYCLDAASGREIWHTNVKAVYGLTEPEWGFGGSPLVEGNVVFLNAGTRGTALDAATGGKVWSTGSEVTGYSSVVPVTHSGKPALAMMTAKALVVVDPRTGSELGRYPWETQYDVNAPDPIVAGGDLVLTSGYKFQEKSGTGASTVLVRSTAGGFQKVWQSRDLASQLSTPVLINGYLYGISGNGDEPSPLRCVDVRTGELKWSSPPAPMGNLTAADGKLIWVAGNGELIVAAANPGSYQELARAQISAGKVWSAPVLANGRLYVRNNKGDITCVDVRGTGPVN